MFQRLGVNTIGPQNIPFILGIRLHSRHRVLIVLYYKKNTAAFHHSDQTYSSVILITLSSKQKNMANKKPENMSFEESLAELDTLVNQLENGDLDLEDALKKFERGISLARVSQGKLSEAEQRVEILLNDSDDAELIPFDPESDI